jgi:hypothetical protein
MRKTIVLLLFLTALCAVAQADGARAQRTRARRPAALDAELMALLRQTREAAEAARDEARRAREQSEALARRLEQTTREVAELRQELRQPPPAEPAIHELKSQLAGLQSRLEESAVKSPTPSTLSGLKDETRLANLEEQVEVHAAQIREHAQTKVESDARFRVRLFGSLLANTYLNSNNSANDDVPIFAAPPSAVPGQKRNNLGATLRQTKLGLAMSGPRLGGARLSAEAEFDFWGGSPTARAEGDVVGVFRIRTASARLDWERTSIEIGQTGPVVSPLNPNSLAAVWYPAMTGTGNLWQWRPHLTLEHRLRLGDSAELIAQAALMPNFNELFRGETLEGDPGYGGRVAFRRPLDAERRIEIGLGGYAERRHFGFGKTVTSRALTADWTLPLGGRVTFSGEAYAGRAVNLAETAGGRIDRLYALNTPVLGAGTFVRGIRTRGGWAQLSLQARADLEFNVAFGKDDPRNDDVRFGAVGGVTRFENRSASANFIYHLTQNFLTSLEYRRHRTDYAPGRRGNHQYNLAFAYLF